jgi:acylglycerol lipase
VHGLFEHSGRYAKFAEYFVPKGYAVCSYDQRGHGRSDGLRGYVNRFADYPADLDLFLKKVRQQYPGKPVFLLGHSMGGTVVATFAADHQEELSGLIFSGLLAMPGASVNRLSIFVTRTVSALLPKMGIATIEDSTISRDSSVVDAYNNDPLVYRGKIRARLGAELLNTFEKVLPAAEPRIQIPVLIMHGGEDRLSNRQSSMTLYDSVGSTDKTIKIYNGFYHEILNDTGRDQVLNDIELWLRDHLPVTTSKKLQS